MECYLKYQVKKQFEKYKGKKIPWIVKLIENPASPLALPGKATLHNHDCLHILLCQDSSLRGEAFILGFCMGSDRDTLKIHVLIFKLISRFLYPKHYRFCPKHFTYFDLGFDYGKSLKVRSINKIDFSAIEDHSVHSIQKCFDIHLYVTFEEYAARLKQF